MESMTMQNIDLSGQKGIVVGYLDSLVLATARHFLSAGADIAILYQTASQEPHRKPLVFEGHGPIVMRCDASDPYWIESAFDSITAMWERIDFVVHAVSSAHLDELRRDDGEISPADMPASMTASCRSFLRVANLAAPHMANGGCLTTLEYIGVRDPDDLDEATEPLRIALAVSRQYLINGCGSKDVRVNAVTVDLTGMSSELSKGGFPEAHSDKTLLDAPSDDRVMHDRVGRTVVMLASRFVPKINGEVVHVECHA